MSEGAWTRLYNGYWNTVEPIKECVGILVAIAREQLVLYAYEGDRA